MRGALRPLVACLIAALLAMLVTGVAYAQTQRSIVGPGESIQRAVNAADPGDTILVRGTHREDVVIRKDGIRLVGDAAVLKAPDRPSSPCGPSGLCVRDVENVTITGFTVRNFPAFGIFAVGARDAKFVKNRAFNNGEYGIAAFSSTGTQVVSNVTGHDGEAGIYIGDSPRANATVVDNETYGNVLGIFVRNARVGSISGNKVHHNCVGMLFLADAPGPAGNFEVRGNTVRKNTRVCKPGETPALSGAGIVLSGARGMEIQGNKILDNASSAPSVFQGGVVVVRGFEGTAPKNNTVQGNTILRNRPDIFRDRSGSGNQLVGNDCRTSKPKGLCGS